MAGSVAVNKLIQIQPHNFEMERSDGEGETATITPPCAHTGPAPVQIRLLCFVEREGQVRSTRLFYYNIQCIIYFSSSFPLFF